MWVIVCLRTLALRPGRSQASVVILVGRSLAAVDLGWASPCQVVLGGSLGGRQGLHTTPSQNTSSCYKQGYKTLRILPRYSSTNLTVLSPQKLIVMTHCLGPKGHGLRTTTCPIRAFAYSTELTARNLLQMPKGKKL